MSSVIYSRILSLLIFAVLLSSSASKGSASDLAGDAHRRHSSCVWQSEDGLPLNSVQCIEQTADGYLWLGGHDGLARFDGDRFTYFNRDFAPELDHNNVTCLCSTRDGSLWIGTENSGLIQYRNGAIQQIVQMQSTSNKTVRVLLESKDRGLLVGTSAGLDRLRNGKLEQVVPNEKLAHPFIRALVESPDGTVWVGTAFGLSRIKDGETQIFREKNGLAHNSIKTLWVDRRGILWIGSDGGLTRSENGEFTIYTKQDGLADNFVSALWEEANGELWIGTYGGLNRMVNGKIITELNEPGVSLSQVKSIKGDREGNLWVGARDGLVQLRERRFVAYTKQDGLSHNNIISVMQDRDGALWVGTWGGGVNVLKGQQWKSYTVEQGLSSDLILSLFQDHSGSVWLGTDFLGGLNRWSEGENTRFKKPGTAGAIFALVEDAEHSLWIGTRNGLVRYQNDQFTVFRTNEGLPDNTVRSLCLDSKSNLWIGTQQGLCRWRDGKFTCYGVTNGLSHRLVMDVYDGGGQGLWIGTRGGGLNRLRNGRFTTYTTLHGLFSDDVYEIIDDGAGFLWMTSSKGIFRVPVDQFNALDGKKISSLTCQHFGKTDGMITTECTGAGKPAVWKTRDGRLWFATSQGLISTSRNIRVNSLPPNVTIEEVLADRQPVRGSFSPVSGAAESESTLEIAPGRGELEIHYTALSFVAPRKNRFKYKLEGCDSDWVEAGLRRVAYYNHLKPGAYRFRVIASNNDAVWNETGASLRITLRPHYWDTWYFRSGVCLAGFGLIFGVLRVRAARRRAIERLRMRIAADLHDDIGSNLASIALLSQIDGSGSGRGELAEINRIALSTANAIREIVWFINPHNDTLDQMIARMRDVSDMLLTGIEHFFEVPGRPRSLHLSPEVRRNIFMIFKEVLHNISKHAGATAVRIQVSEEHGHFILQVADNGKGFDEGAVRKGNGLKNMRLRAGQLHGGLRIESVPGKGTTVRLEIKIT